MDQEDWSAIDSQSEEDVMKISQSIAYALFATTYLATLDDRCPVPCSELAQRGKLPIRFLLQVLCKLVKGGVLTSACGTSGGYSLAKSPDQISLREVFEAIDPPSKDHYTALGCLPSGTRSRITKALTSAHKVQMGELQSWSLADVVNHSRTQAGVLAMPGLKAITKPRASKVPTEIKVPKQTG